MSNKKSSQDALDKIMSGQIKQIPRWHFVLRNIVLWTVGLLCVLAGALTVSLIIFTIANSALSMRGLAYQSFWQHTIAFVPLLWIFGSVLFIGLFKLSIRHTKRGYKYSLITILGASLLLSIIVGVIFYFLGVSHLVDNMLGQHFRSYHSVERRQARVFDNPDKGVLIGRVTESDEDKFTFMTPSGTKWIVVKKNIPAHKQHFIVEGERFVVMGEKISEDMFVACDVFKRGMMGENRRLQQQRLHNSSEICKPGTCAHNKRVLPQNIDEMINNACVNTQFSQ